MRSLVESRSTGLLDSQRSSVGVAEGSGEEKLGESWDCTRRLSPKRIEAGWEEGLSSPNFYIALLIDTCIAQSPGFNPQ